MCWCLHIYVHMYGYMSQILIRIGCTSDEQQEQEEIFRLRAQKMKDREKTLADDKEKLERYADMDLCTYICIYIYTYIDIYVYGCVNTYNIHVCVCIYVYTYILVFVHMYTYIYTDMQEICMYVYLYVNIYKYIYI